MAKYILFISLLMISCTSSELFELTGQTMGTTYSVKGFSKGIDKSLLKKEIESFLKAYNNKFSTYIDSSELSLINKAPVGKKLKVSSELLSLIKKAKTIYNKTSGYYDITVGPLVNRWGFGPLTDKGKPSSSEVSEILSKTGMDNLEIFESAIVKKSDIYIDLSSIAKGDGVDGVARVLEDKFNIKDYFVEIGGEVKVRGEKPNKQNWKIGIEKPALAKGSGIQKIISLENQSIATSGSYRNYKKYGDSVFSHLINPKTGYPVDHKTISVSVISEDCAIADAWATAFIAMGVQKSLKIAKKEGLKVYFLVKENGKIKGYTTSNFGY